MKYSEPRWLSGLPRWGGRFPLLPSPAGNTNTPSARKPDSEQDPRADARRIAALAMRGCCSVCGYPFTAAVWCHMPPDVVEANGVRVAQGVGPMHLSCALFSSLSCPWVSSRPKAGEVPVVTGFAGYGVMLGGRHPEPSGTPLRFGYFDAVERVPHTDLRRRYEQSLVTDEPDTAQPRLWWGDDVEGEQRLAQCCAEDSRTLREMHDTAPAFPSVARVWPASGGHIDLTADPKLRAVARAALAAAAANRHNVQDMAKAVMAAAAAGRRSLVRDVSRIPERTVAL